MTRFRGIGSPLLAAALLSAAHGGVARAQERLADDVLANLRRDCDAVAEELAAVSALGPAAFADAAIFHKGLAWALRDAHELTPTDLPLLENAARRCRERVQAARNHGAAAVPAAGKMALGYVSSVDGSVQPYGLIVPRGYSAERPLRLDVVLHGSTRPAGMFELRFIGRFDEADASGGDAPDSPYLELHPLGRIENCYRWAGETDVLEAIDDVCRRFAVDRRRIVLRGMSMGASGTWHLGLHHPDRFVALGPYCGYVDTHRFSESPLEHFVRVGPLPEHQERTLHMLDAVDYAANAGVVPAIACMGEKDVFFDAHVMMEQAMRREGLQMVNLISPGTGHEIDPVTQAEQLRLIGAFAAAGLDTQPRRLRFVTWTLKYPRCHWAELLRLDRHYARSEFEATLRDDLLEVTKVDNVRRFQIATDRLPGRPSRLRVGGSELALPPLAGRPPRLVVDRGEGEWAILPDQGPPSTRGKRPGLQGPIDDAFCSAFLCVRGTGVAWNPRVHAYAQQRLDRFAREWRRYFRGELPVKDDRDVTLDDVRSRHLVLFGDPGSNSWLGKLLPQLPLTWTRETLRFAGQEHPAADHLPALILPNPLDDTGRRYVVVNSGHTFQEAELSTINYLLFPRWGDWSVLRVPAESADGGPQEEAVRSGFFNEDWALDD